MKSKELIKILQKIPDAELWVTGEVEFCKLNPENIDYDKARNIFWFDAVGFNSPEPEILELMKEGNVLTDKSMENKMDARISKEGYLLLKRQYSNEFRSQFCPYTLMEEEQQECGEWCPHFDVVFRMIKAGGFPLDGIRTCQKEIIPCESIEIEKES
jgi:hypothetical protein